jgi:NADP-dependent 3-hydroxy acid dehydrogenase YdfG
MKKGIIIIGMGKGLSLGIAKKFGNEGFEVGMISRNEENLKAYQSELHSLDITSFYASADVSSERDLISALEKLKKEMSHVTVLQYNAVDYRMVHVLDETAETLTNGFKISVANVITAVKNLLPTLVDNKGSILLTGGGTANYPYASMSSISLGKAGIKNLAFQLSDALKEKNIFVGTLTICNMISDDSETHNPTILANKFWDLNESRTEIEKIY